MKIAIASMDLWICADAEFSLAVWPPLASLAALASGKGMMIDPRTGWPVCGAFIIAGLTLLGLTSAVGRFDGVFISTSCAAEVQAPPPVKATSDGTQKEFLDGLKRETDPSKIRIVQVRSKLGLHHVQNTFSPKTLSRC